MNMWNHITPDDLSPTASDTQIECHSCGASTTGYQMGELVVVFGWRMHSIGLGLPMFVMCGECMERFEEKWAA
jgi:hypothetical protein